MAKNPKQFVPTKKHLARIERERMQTRYILIGSLVVVIGVLLTVGYGIIDQIYLQKIRPVATVNGEKITTENFQKMIRYSRQRLVNSALETYQLIQYFGNDSQGVSYIANQLGQISNQLQPSQIGQEGLDVLINGALMRQEAKRRGIEVSQEEIDNIVREAFNYYPQGTPTSTPTRQSQPTSTLSPTQYALVSPTPIASATPLAAESISPTVQVTPTLAPSITPTLAPTLTPTPYTEASFTKIYQETMKQFKDSIDFTEEDFKQLVLLQIYREKLKKVVLMELNVIQEQEQVWSRHILINDETTAKEVITKLEKGEDWTKLAAEYSTDPGNKDQGGDLGWASKGMLDPQFEEVAFKLAIGEISQPVKTQYGWHIIQVLGHEKREIPEAEFQQIQEEKFSEWLDTIRKNADIKIDETWVNRVPIEPSLPAEIMQFIQANLIEQATPQSVPTQIP